MSDVTFGVGIDGWMHSVPARYERRETATTRTVVAVRSYRTFCGRDASGAPAAYWDDGLPTCEDCTMKELNL